MHIKKYMPKEGAVKLKAIGIARPLDSLGRIVLPKELRNVMGIKEGRFLLMVIG